MKKQETGNKGGKIWDEFDQVNRKQGSIRNM